LPNFAGKFLIVKPVHFAAITVAVLITAGLYFGANTIPPKSEPETEQQRPSGNMPMTGAMPGVELPKPANFDSLKISAVKKLSPQLAAKLKDKEQQVTTAASASLKIAANEELAALWQTYKNPAISAYYYAEAAKLENSEKKLNFAAHLFFEQLKQEHNPNVRQWMADNAIACFTKALQINPANDEARIDLASIYIDGTGETMKGVQELLTITRRDSTNLEVNLILGRMAVESGQLDKAIARGELILRHYKDNWQARVFMAEAYKRDNKPEKAKTLLNEAKAIKNDAAFSKDVDEYMKTF